MFKILVADDEDLIRKGIITILRRELDPDITYFEAENGIEALKLCKEHSPQLVITDIRMPFCDGLSFIKNIKEVGNSPTFIILSGYADFEYAKSAIKLGVKEYMLKPINKAELVTIVDGYVKKLKTQKKLINENLFRENENKKIAENMKRKLLKNLLTCNNTDNVNELLNQLNDLGISFNKKLLLSAVIRYQVNDGNKDYIDFAVKNIVDEVLAKEANPDFIMTVQYDSGKIVAVFEDVNRETMLLLVKQALTKVSNLIEKYLFVDVFVGVGDVVYGENLLYKSFSLACAAVNYRLYNLSKKVQLFSETPVSLTYEPIDFSKIIKSIENINCSEIITEFEKQLSLPPSLQAISVIEQSYNKLICTIEHHFRNYIESNTENIPKPTPFFDIWSFLQFKQVIIKYLGQVQEFALKSKTDVVNRKLVVEVLQYVKENAASDINLNIVADKFDRTPAYMSTLFKKGTGMGFNEYVTSIRMEMAKRMLKDTSIPVSQVSSLCGYVNPKYFSVVFKGTFGKSPASYRQDPS